MAAYDQRDDIPEADRAEQERDVFPTDDADDAPGSEIEDLEVDPLKADEADQIEQALSVPVDDDYDQP